MELIIKLYSDKPSKIGVKYPQKHSAVKAYEELFPENVGTHFSLKMELVKNKMNLLLLSEHTGEHVVYKELDFKLEHLKKLETFVNQGAELQFVHVFSKSNTLMVAKPFRSLRFISLTHYEIIGSVNSETNF